MSKEDVWARLPAYGQRNEIMLEATSNVPRWSVKSSCSDVSHFQAQTVKNLSSCSSSACWPKVDSIEVKDPWMIYRTVNIIVECSP